MLGAGRDNFSNSFCSGCRYWALNPDSPGHYADPLGRREVPLSCAPHSRAELAMEEIARGLVHYDVPACTGVEAEPLSVLPPNRRARR
jgi:hypothetical protein